MNKATQQNYIKHFGPDAFVPGYCGKCPGAGKVGDDPVCLVYADDAAPRILPSEDGCNEPPEWCPIRHISRQPLLAQIRKLETDRDAAILFLKSITFDDGDAGDKLMEMLRSEPDHRGQTDD